MDILTTFRLDNGMTVLVCEPFTDDQVTSDLRLDGVKIEKFTVEPVRTCFSKPKSRHIVVKDKLLESQFKQALFV